MSLGVQAYGLAWKTSDGQVLDVWYPSMHHVELSEGIIGESTHHSQNVPPQLGELTTHDVIRGMQRIIVHTCISDISAPPVDVCDAYLRLHLLSARKVKPHEVNVTGIFGILPNVVWTNYGPCQVDNFEDIRLLLAQRGVVTVYGVDKFPRMLDYVVPTGVRIADADRVRLGAYLAPGTTVMHEGFVNFNAGTLGSSMIEGRVSAGVVIGNGSDIGGGASIMGTLSGGGKHVISIGERCLIGANAGVGISLGDDCTVEAGLYITAGCKVELPDLRSVKASELSGESGLLFIRDSREGKIKALPHKGQSIALNPILHAN